jgi:glutamate-ammonia-ligase adenylyltransferase
MASELQGKILQTVESLPALLRDPVLRWFERLDGAGHRIELADDELAALAKLIACSEYAAGVVLRDWHWFADNIEKIDEAPDTALLDELVSYVGDQCTDADEAKARIRRFRHRWMVQVLWRQLSGEAGLDETLASQSLLAERLLVAATGFATRYTEKRFGVVRLENGHAAPLVTLGMGKLGGAELNFSSDIDIIFLYPGDSDSDGRKVISAHEYFGRVSRHVVALLDEVTADGFAFRVDTRLRPFGDSGPPVTSFAALESYLLQHGRYWERYAYVKARIVVGDRPAELADELINDIVRPFVYRRYLDFGVFEALREMHAMISAEVQRRELADNIKLGPGGIREIEFIVQSLQLVRGGSHPELQRCELIVALRRLTGRHGLDEVTAQALEEAYRFLRELENIIQGLRDQQTHKLPDDASDRARLCLAMGFAGWNDLVAELDRHRDRVSKEFSAVAFRGQDARDARVPSPLAGPWERGATAGEWARVLDDAGFEQADEIAESLVRFADAPSARHISSIARQRLNAFMPELLRRVHACSNPLVALNRVLAIVEKILRRSAYLALLNENSDVLSHLVNLCEQSGYIADQVARFPVLLDELLDPSVGSAPLTLDELEEELDGRLAACADDDSEAQVAVLGQFQRASLFRVAIADFAGSLPIMKVSDSLTWLAEAVIRQALNIALRDLVAKHGSPRYLLDGEYHAAGFAVIAYGKFGGLEMSYGSDLDLVFLHDSAGEDRNTTGPKPLDNTMFFTRLVRRLSHFLTAQTGSGRLYEVDTRLRPDGQSGVMVSSIESFERYQEDNAWTWEHQALLRARPVAGSKHVGDAFQRVRAQTLASRVRLDRLRDDVVQMRQRMRKNLDRSSDTVFDLKQGSGGIGDIEFIVQYLVLANASDDASLYAYTDNIRQLDALAAAEILAGETAARLQETYRRYRQRLHHLSLDEKSVLVGAEEFAEERRFVEAVWTEVL